MWHLFGPLALLFALGCGSPPAPESAGHSPDAAAAPTPEAAPDPEPDWSPQTTSPHPAQESSADSAALADCARTDAALGRVAVTMAARLADGRSIADTAELGHELRRAGAPYVWPRAWSLVGPSVEPRQAAERAAAWLAKLPPQGERRCGVGRARGSAGDAVVVLMCDVVADLLPLPSRARTGQWLEVRARIGGASEAKVVLLGPRGPPKPIPTAMVAGEARARFTPSEPGAWLVQVLANVDAGPRPVAEAWVFADAAPPSAFQSESAPGERAGGAATPAGALLAMMNAARAAEGLRPLTRDAALEDVARQHAEAMRSRGLLAHDAGEGGVSARLQAAGLTPSSYGENIARAENVARAHRVIWASPSHRGNLLDPRYRAVGVAVVEDQSVVWVAQIFATFR